MFHGKQFVGVADHPIGPVFHGKQLRRRSVPAQRIAPARQGRQVGAVASLTSGNAVGVFNGAVRIARRCPGARSARPTRRAIEDPIGHLRVAH